MHSKILLLMFVSFCLLTSCSKDPISKAKDFIEIQDYSNAIQLLEKHLKENTRDIEARTLLIDVYETDEQLEKAAEQLNIMTKIDTADIFVYRQMRVYAQLGQWDKLSDLKNTVEMPELDSLSSIDYVLAIGLLELHNNNKEQFTALLQRTADLKSEYRKYFLFPLNEYMGRLKKPDMKNYVLTPGTYLDDLQGYHNLRGKIYEIMAIYDKALQEYNTEISWYKYSPNPTAPAYIKYEDKIKLLKKTGDYNQFIETVLELKNSYGEEDDLNIKHAEKWLEEAQKGF